jgi:hypothetical protein
MFAMLYKLPLMNARFLASAGADSVLYVWELRRGKVRISQC